MHEAAQFVLLLLACFLGAGMLLSIRNGFFSPYFLFFSYLTVGIVVRGLYLLDDSSFDASEFWPTVAPSVMGDFLPAYLEFFLAIVIATASSRVFMRIRNPMEIAFLRFFSLRSTDIPFAVTLLTTLFCSLTYTAALAISQGGLMQAFVVLQKRAVIFGSEVFFIRILSVVSSIAISLLVYKISSESRTTRHIRKAAVIGALVLHFTILLLLPAGGRGTVITLILVLLYVRNRGLDRGDIGFRSTFLIVGFASIVLVGGMALRSSAQLGTDTAEAILDSVKNAGHTVSGAFCITDLYLSARHFADSTGHDYGMQFLLYFVRFFPRSLWVEKPFNLGFSMREFYYGDTLAGVIPTIFGEFYIAWGSIGLVLCGLFLGWMLSFLDRAFRYSQQDSRFALIYVLLATCLVFDGLRAGLEMAVFMTLYFLITLTFFKLIARLRKRMRYP
jgi:oligosaccharide repeat unit polymerase